MPCIEAPKRRWALWPMLMLAACASRVESPPVAPAAPPPSTAARMPQPAAAPTPATPVTTTPAVTAAPRSEAAPAAAAPAPAAAPSMPPAPRVVMPAPARPRNHEELRLQAARRLVQANPTRSYSGAVPEPLLAIPVLEVELHADGSVRRIDVLRRPRQALDTVQLAIDAVHRAAPFGDVSRLPKPWKFSEVFLFDGERRFKPRTLDR